MAKLSPQGPFRALDGNGAPLSEGRLYTYEAGTTTPKDTFTTSVGDVANSNPVELDSTGYADVWLGSGSYKLVLTDKNDVVQYTLDNVLGDTTAGFGGSTTETNSNLNITSVFDKSAVICTDTLTLSLLDAESAGDGFYFIVKNSGAGTVTIDPDLSETIDGVATIQLQSGESAIIRSQGENWNTLFLNVIQDGSITTEKIADDAVTAEKIADGVLLTKADQPEAEAGTDNDKYMTALRTQQNYEANAQKALQVQHQETSGTNGGPFNSGAWRTRTLNTVLTNNITGSSLSLNQITLPAGTYHVQARCEAGPVNENKLKLRDITNTLDLLIGDSNHSAAGSGVKTRAFVNGQINLADETVLEVQHQCATTNSTLGFGQASGFGVVEVYADITITKIG